MCTYVHYIGTYFHYLNIDLPTIISGEWICYMDSQKEIWKGDPGHKYKLTKNNPKYNDSFTPFQFHDTCSLGSNYTYPGTLIRLPLRGKSSGLSNTLYDIEKLKVLINALKDDADILLLFLRYVEKVEVFVISDRGKVSKSFSVKLYNAENIRTPKNDFFTEVKKYYANPKPHTLPQLHYEVTIVIQDFEVNSRKDCHWVIVHRVGYETYKIVKDTKKNSGLPWVGVALPLSSQCSSRLFCFLPMPDSKEINPPLPVCVHGTFGLTKDRRHLKWPTSDTRNDDGALWNDILLSKMLPSCYANCLSVLKDKCDLNEFYLLWPKVFIVQNTNWEITLKPLLSLLLEDQLFWSQNGSWVKLQSSVYVVPQMNSGQFPQVVINALIKCGKVVVVLADRVWEAVDFMYTASKYPFTTITSSLVRQSLKNNAASYSNVTRAEKFELLNYCIEDEQYSDLCDIVLLPLANNTFTAFTNRGKYQYPIKRWLAYTCDKDFLETKLLANNEVALVNVEAEDSNLHHKLIEIADSNCTQLQQLTTDAVAVMLRQLLPFQNGWCYYGAVGDFYNENWLKTFWKWVSAHQLFYFVDIPLLPICNEKSSKGFKVVALQNKSKSLVIKYYRSAYFNPKLIDAVGKLGCSLTCSQDFKFLHRIDLNDYVHDFTPSSVLSISSQMMSQSFTFTQEEAKALRCFLFQYPPVSLSAQQKTVLLNMRIFPSIQSDKLCSLQNAISTVAGKSAAMIVLEPECLNKYKFCIPSSPLLLTYFNKNSIDNLQIMLPRYLWFPTKLEIILHVILQNKQKLTKENIMKLFSVILESKEYHSLLTDPDSKLLIDSLLSIKFVPTCKAFNNLASPCEVYDPEDLIVKELFEGQNVFPVAPFAEDHFSVLRELGMKSSADLEIPDIIKVAQWICDQNNTKAKTARAHKLLEFLSSSTGNVLLNYHFAFSKTLATMPWLPVMVIPPKDYPKCLDWKGATGSYFLSPKHVHASSTQDHHKKLPYLIGSQMRILQFEGMLLPKLLALLQISECVPVDAMIQHTLSLIHSQHKVERSQLKNYMELLYEHLQLAIIDDYNSQYWHYLSQSEIVQVSKNKFVKPSLVACSFDDKSMTIGKLEPYLYILPSNLQQYRELFCFIGVKEQVTLDDVLAVLENIASNQNMSDQKLTINILKWICDNFTDSELKQLHDRILVPIDGDDIKNKFVLKPANQVAYLDKDLQWLKKDKVALSNIMENHSLVHSTITADRACALQLKPLNKMIADNEELCFEQAGQSEPLTTRLNRILKEYKDTSVIQELLQNADDAEAQEVAIYYDTRNHDKRNLFFPGMANSYGPALLFYNSTEFSQDDFKNITRISGETKANEPLKIGKFGVGFCSVYHITDVPSFLSGETFFIFDPTLQCLHNEITSKFNPGIKINYIKHRFLKMSNQFIPYTGVHGFDPKKPFKGTLFRLPLRCRSSQISKNICTEDKLLSIIDEVKQNAPKLLMFLNNVKRISFHQSHGSNFKKIFAITATKTHIATINDSSLTKYKVFSPQFGGCKEENWIISTNFQQFKQPSIIDCVQDGIASVSVRLKINAKTEELQCIDPVKGECFCFLPLHIETGLPVHVSSNFAVMINRRGLWKADNSGYATKESEWNKKLMETVVFQAYIALLLYLKQVQHNGTLKDYSYYCLWPVQLRETVPWEVLFNKFYDSILSSGYPLFYSRIGGWKHLNESKFLSSNILLAGFQKDLLLALEKVTNILRLPVVDLPGNIWNRFVNDDCFSEQTINEEQFLHLFYDNNTLSKVSNKHKNIIIVASLIAYANNEHTEKLPDLMIKTKCIPCCPNGIKYKKPQEVVDPKSKVSNLFSSDECMCPDNDFLMQSDLLHQSLVNLGMMQSLPWELVVDRAKKLQYTMFKEESLKECDYLNTLIGCIKENLNQEISPSIKNELQKIAFLPVMQKPPDFMLDWKGESDSHFLCGPKLTKLTEGNNNINAIYACGSQVAILDTNEVSSKLLTNEVLNVLGVTKQIETWDVINHFNVLLEWFYQFSVDKLDKSIIQFTSNVATQVYRYWGKVFEAEQLPLESLSCFRDKACVWNGMTFLHPSVISFNWPTDGPFVYKLPDMLPYSIRPIMKYLGVEDDFPVKILVNALCKMKQQYKESCLTPESQAVVSLILPKIANNVPDDVEIFLPDSKYILRNAKKLKYNDAPWCTLQKKYMFCHCSIGRDIALGLKVEPVRNAVLKKFEFQNNPNLNTFSVEFGQEEKLTERLKNILNDYPKDCTFIKEIIQNADDSGAKKLYVILDKRQHMHDSEKVISEEWKMLQGPALMVWNDSTFTEDDFAGIQKLGLGSKRDDADKIGRYGIGFNVVYNFTDCPSFVTDNKLCIMDPLYHFIAVEGQKPGMMFNDFNELCKIFPGMKSPYLLNDKGKIPNEINKKGALFRLPLRLTEEMVEVSKLSSDTISLNQLEMDLTEWVSEVSEALLFMQHVDDVRYYVINDRNWSDSLRIHLRSSKGSKTVEECGKSKLVLYPLTLYNGSSKSQWFVQLGEGNVEDPDFDWDQAKPQNTAIQAKHGIAIPIRNGSFEGKSFCFLPLPNETHLPVHVHGYFILRSDRRGLWISSDMKTDDKRNKSGSDTLRIVYTDSKTKWNELLLRAIGVSYAHLLISYRNEISASEKSMRSFYKLFPKLTACNDKHWLILAEQLYITLIDLNAPILAKLIRCVNDNYSKSTDKQFSAIKWYALCNPGLQDECFFHTINDDDLHNVLAAVGMNIIDTPMKIYYQFKKVNNDLQLLVTSAESILKYYSQFCDLIYNGNPLPCLLSCTKFKNIKCFTTFIQYLMQENEKFLDEDSDSESNSESENTDIKDLLTLGLIVTADEYLHCLSDGLKIVSSTYWNLFPNSHHCFIHEDLQEIYPHDSDYLLSDKDKQLECISSIIADNIPSSWKETTEARYSQKNVEKITLLLECLVNDPVFYEHCDDIMMEFPLLPANNGRVYSKASKVLPLENVLVPDTEFQYNIDDAKELMKKLKVPLLRHDLVGSLMDEINIRMPSISSPEHILKTLYLIKHLNGHVYGGLNKNELELLFTILQLISYSSISNQDYIKHLPIFTTINGELVSLVSASEVWICDANEICTAGINEWIKYTSDSVIFLDSSSPWACLQHEAKHLGMQSINTCKYDVYRKFIFPNFHLLDSSAQMDHLKFIKKEIYPACMLAASRFGYSKDDDNVVNILNFIDDFKALRCIPDGTGDLQTINFFYDHEEMVFKLFCNENYFLPVELRSKEWLEFLEYFGLKVAPTRQQFVSYCKQLIIFDDISSIKTASLTLLNALFYEPPLYTDNKYKDIHTFECLQEVSKIPVMIVEDTPDLKFIAAQKLGEHAVRHHDITLTKLAGSSLKENKYLVWTIAPLIELSCYNKSSQVHQNKLKNLEVLLSPSIDDVALNLKNLSVTMFADSLRTNEPSTNLVISQSKLLPKVVITMLEHMQQKMMSKKCKLDCHELSQSEIIPVKTSVHDVEEYILVKPVQVLYKDPSDMAPYYPFLYPLIEEAYGVLTLLLKIGVEMSLNFSHIKYILESAKNAFKESEVDSRNKEIILKATQDLVELLKQAKTKDDIIPHLQPLYLLSEENILMECHRLVVYDMTHTNKFSLPSGYAYLHSFVVSRELLQYLPKEFGLSSLKSILSYEIVNDSPTENFYPYVSTLGNIIKSKELKDALLLFSSYCTQNTISPCVASIIVNFQNNLTIKYYNNLHAIPQVTLGEKLIHLSNTINYSFFLEKSNDQQWILSLKNTNDGYSLSSFMQLAKQLCSSLQLKSTGCFEVADDNGLPELTTYVYTILQCASVSDIANVIKVYIPEANVNNADFEVTSGVSMNSTFSDSILERYDQQLLDLLLPAGTVSSGERNNQGSNTYRAILQNITEELNELAERNPEPQVDIEEAKVWIRQANYDYAALSALMHVSKTDKAHFATVCFMSHQVAEKSLKAGTYAKCGLDPMNLCTHQLTSLATKLNQMGCSVNTQDATLLNGFYLPTRYPNRWCPSAVPEENYSSNTAQRAFHAATRIFEEMQKIIDDIS